MLRYAICFTCAATLSYLLCGMIGPRPVEAAPDSPRGYALADAGNVGGLWVQRDTQGRTPFAGVYSCEYGATGPMVVMGLSRNQKGDGHDFAVVANGAEVYFQIRDKDGKFHFIPVEALLKLADKDAKVKSPMGVAK